MSNFVPDNRTKKRGYRGGPMDDATAKYIPSLEQIKAGTEAIQKTWSADEKYRRSLVKPIIFDFDQSYDMHVGTHRRSAHIPSDQTGNYSGNDSVS